MTYYFNKPTKGVKVTPFTNPLDGNQIRLDSWYYRHLLRFTKSRKDFFYDKFAAVPGAFKCPVCGFVDFGGKCSCPRLSRSYRVSFTNFDFRSFKPSSTKLKFVYQSITFNRSSNGLL
jgi:hypothetical protein